MARAPVIGLLHYHGEPNQLYGAALIREQSVPFMTEHAGPPPPRVPFPRDSEFEASYVSSRSWIPCDPGSVAFT